MIPNGILWACYGRQVDTVDITAWHVPRDPGAPDGPSSLFGNCNAYVVGVTQGDRSYRVMVGVDLISDTGQLSKLLELMEHTMLMLPRQQLGKE